jgi:hypothetical protein
MASTHRPSTPQEADIRQPYAEGSFAAVPTGFTRFLRTFIPFQLWRFAAINVRMIRMIFKSHG